MSKQKTTLAEIKQYIAFLEKRLASANYKSRVTPEEYAKTKEKLSKERSKLKLLS